MRQETNSPEVELEQIYSTVGSEPVMAPVKKSGKFARVFLTIVLLLVVVAVVLLVISKTTKWNVLGLSKAPVGAVAKASDWQAVFLTNGQVYFGKLKNVNSSYPLIEDIYYLQVQNVPIQPAEPATGTEGGVQPAAETKQEIILVKFGTEMHRPMDKMYINKDHIMFFEDMSEESSVVKAIEAYKISEAGKK